MNEGDDPVLVAVYDATVSASRYLTLEELLDIGAITLEGGRITPQDEVSPEVAAAIVSFVQALQPLTEDEYFQDGYEFDRLITDAYNEGQG